MRRVHSPGTPHAAPFIKDEPGENVLRSLPGSVFWDSVWFCWFCSRRGGVRCWVISRDVLPVLSDACFSCHGLGRPVPQGGPVSIQPRAPRTPGRAVRWPWFPGIQGEANSSGASFRRIQTRSCLPEVPSPVCLRRSWICLKRWIAEGASWGRHWAYEVPVRPSVPEVRGWRESSGRIYPGTVESEDSHRRAGGIPRGVDSKGDAGFDGVPPTLAERSAFLHDELPGAYERLVDRLLASPRYGERMAGNGLRRRVCGFQWIPGDGERTMWPWRDWVISAFNRNLPYDQFTLGRSPGIGSPAPLRSRGWRRDSLRNHTINGVAGEFRRRTGSIIFFDQTETVATVWLAATFNCTRRHDHKA